MLAIRLGIVLLGLVAASKAIITDAAPGEFPYQISITFNQRHFCSGALIVNNGTQLVVTTASCGSGNFPMFDVLPPGIFPKFLGLAAGLKARHTYTNGQIRKVKRITIHPQYRKSDQNDIAVLVPATPFDINEKVAPIPLPSPQQHTSGQVIASGWLGFNALQFYASNILQKFPGYVVDDRTCSGKIPFPDIVSPSSICMGADRDQRCMWECGSPVRAAEGGYLAGIASWAWACDGYPFVGTEISYFIDWINENSY